VRGLAAAARAGEVGTELLDLLVQAGAQVGEPLLAVAAFTLDLGAGCVPLCPGCGVGGSELTDLLAQLVELQRRSPMPASSTSTSPDTDEATVADLPESPNAEASDTADSDHTDDEQPRRGRGHEPGSS
jgi:hypothetical protein